ncbi:hypothetical protein [Mycobacteroides sp. CBMA 326]|uniref:hypothetical protein n=1 Tax=Mycobacteroides sp. CBMA 326 TaxID=1904945 RepID=UPI00281686C9|nr:hypothetical protein [Mycobacteroides sp. CBMA 326]
MLTDVESINDWLSPHLPAWPTITSRTTIVETYDDGMPLLVRTRSSVLGISDDILTEYNWSPTGCTTTLRRSSALRHHVARYTVVPRPPGTQLIVDSDVDLKIKLPWLLERHLLRAQTLVLRGIQRALAVESARREAAPG